MTHCPIKPMICRRRNCSSTQGGVVKETSDCCSAVNELPTVHILTAFPFHSSRWDSTASGVETFVSLRNLA